MRTVANIIFTAFMLSSVIGLGVSRAAADVTVCNSFTYPVYVAIGYKTVSDLKTEGWWLIESNACQLVDNRTVTGPYYIHAHTQWIHDANGTRIRHAWGKGKRLAIDSHKFEFFRADQIATGDQTEDFTLVGGGRYPNITYRILDAETSEHRESE